MSASSFKSQGNEHFKQEEWEKAIDCYSKAIELEKNQIASAPLFANRAAAYLKVGNLDKGPQSLHSRLVASELTCQIDD